MRSRYRINIDNTAHFITSTIVEWLPVFTTAACCDIIVRSLEYCRRHKGLRIHAWVIPGQSLPCDCSWAATGAHPRRSQEIHGSATS
jgi:hypothetical protein